MGLNKRSASTASVNTNTNNNTSTTMTNDIFAAYNNPAPQAQTTQPKQQPMTQETMIRFHLNISQSYVPEGQVIAGFHNGKVSVTHKDAKAFFSFRLKSDKHGAVRVTKLHPDGSVSHVDVEDAWKHATNEVHFVGDFRNANGKAQHREDAIEMLEEVAAITISVPVSAFNDRGAKPYGPDQIVQNIFGVSMCYITTHDEPFVDNEIEGEVMDELFPSSKKTSNGLTAEAIRRRVKKAEKKASVEVAKATQAEIAEVVAPEPTPAPAQNDMMQQMLAQMQQMNANMAAMQQTITELQAENAALKAAAAAPIVEEPVVETPEVEEEAPVEPTPEPEVEAPAPAVSDKKAALLAMLNGAKNHEPEALQTAVATGYGDVTVDFDFDEE